mmetsp:Transcript_37017/g.89244  ORF Transcript_37017/g.89244 Transcript_37017/m.89244 type:complete len:254 (+) Transcript_37017:1814-2575(+)
MMTIAAPGHQIRCSEDLPSYHRHSDPCWIVGCQTPGESFLPSSYHRFAPGRRIAHSEDLPIHDLYFSFRLYLGPCSSAGQTRCRPVDHLSSCLAVAAIFRLDYFAPSPTIAGHRFLRGSRRHNHRNASFYPARYPSLSLVSTPKRNPTAGSSAASVVESFQRRRKSLLHSRRRSLHSRRTGRTNYRRRRRTGRPGDWRWGCRHNRRPCPTFRRRSRRIPTRTSRRIRLRSWRSRTTRRSPPAFRPMIRILLRW